MQRMKIWTGIKPAIGWHESGRACHVLHVRTRHPLTSVTITLDPPLSLPPPHCGRRGRGIGKGARGNVREVRATLTMISRGGRLPLCAWLMTGGACMTLAAHPVSLFWVFAGWRFGGNFFFFWFFPLFVLFFTSSIVYAFWRGTEGRLVCYERKVFDVLSNVR